MKQYETEQECIDDAIALQDACNPTALAGTLRAMCSFLMKERGTDATCSHPAVKATIGKLASLAGISHDPEDAYKDLYDWARTINME